MGIKLKLSDIDFTPIIGVSTKDPAPSRPRTMVARFMVSIPSADGESRVLLCNRGGEGGAPIPVLVTTDKGRARERVAEAFGVLGGRPKWFRSAYRVSEDGTTVSAPDEKGVFKKTTAHIAEATSRWTREDGVTLYTVASPAQELEFDSRSVDSGGIAFEEDYIASEKESYASWLSRWGAPAPKPVEAAPEDMAAMIAQAVAAAVAAAMPTPTPVKEPVADAATIAAMMAKIEELTAQLAAAQGGSTEGE